MNSIAFSPRMTNDCTSRAIAGAAGAPLSREQKTRLILASQDAMRMQVKVGLWTEADGDFETFRHAAAFDACGVGSFRAMQQRHYMPALLHFRSLAGHNVVQSQARLATDDSRRALGQLKMECQRAADCFGGWQGAWAYASTLFRKIHRCEAATATAKQVWQVIFTLRNRAIAARKRAMPARIDSEAGSASELSAHVLDGRSRFAGLRGALAGTETGRRAP